MKLKPIRGARARSFALADVDLSQRADRRSYAAKLEALQHALQTIQQAYLHTKDKAVIVFEGWDAGGKGGTIRRFSAAMDPRGFKVWPIGAPSAYEKQRHYLQRFWERLPAEGEIVVFDRSWYGRVLVERVQGFAEPAEWQRAFDEINEFERQLADDGTRVVKIFLHISPEVQMERFLARLEDPKKRWKLTEDDFRNRARWGQYCAAIEDMVHRTATKYAPWWAVAANDKKHARLRSLDIIAAELSHGVDLSPRPVDETVRKLATSMVPPPKADAG